MTAMEKHRQPRHGFAVGDLVRSREIAAEIDGFDVFLVVSIFSAEQHGFARYCSERMILLSPQGRLSFSLHNEVDESFSLVSCTDEAWKELEAAEAARGEEETERR